MKVVFQMQQIVSNKSFLDDFISALFIEERYHMLKHNKDFLKEKKEVIENWTNRKTILDEKNFEDIYKTNNYEKTFFSEAVDYENSDYLNYEELKDMDWYITLHEILDNGRVKGNHSPEMGYQFVFRHFSDFAYRAILNKRKKYNFLDDSIIISIMDSLNLMLLKLSQKTIIYEINLKRINGALKGSTAEERFVSYFKTLSDNQNILNFYKKYPLLARLLTETTQNYIENLFTLLSDYTVNKDLIMEILGIDCNEKIIAIEFGKGDTHASGKTVAILHFEKSKIVYKPKNLEIAVAYNKFIEWLNSNFSKPQVKTYKIVALENSTFEEYILPGSCENFQEIKEYFTNFGKLAAVLYILRGTDFHMENIMADKQFPIVVDLETLLQQQNPYKKSKNENFYIELGYKIAKNSISRTALFPGIGIKANLDLSGLSGNEQEVPFETEVIVNDQTDEVRYSKETGILKRANNIPKVSGKEVYHHEYIEEIIDGFKTIYEFFYMNKEEIKEKIKIFKKTKTRVLIRNTMNYAQMLEYSYLPDCMESAKGREQLFENMWKFSIEQKEVIKSEVYDLLHNDIPIFFTYTDATFIINSRGERLHQYFQKSNYSKLIENIDKLSMEKCSKQISNIRLLTKQYDTVTLSTRNKIKISEIGLKPTTKVDFVSKACEVADFLMNQANEDPKTNKILFECIVPKEDGWAIGVSNESFYNGLSGLLFFFYFLFKKTNEEKYKIFYKKLLSTLLDYPNLQGSRNIVTGQNSTVLPLSYIYLDEKDKDTERQIRKLVLESFEESEKSKTIDWLKGQTSLLQLCIKMYKNTEMNFYLRIAKKISNKLIENYKMNEEVIHGFSHGISSLAVSLFQMHEVDPRGAYINLGKELLDIEQKRLLSTNEINTSWCHGLTGIEMVNSSLSDFDFLRADLQKRSQIIETRMTNSYLSEDDTLCHGNSGIVHYYLEKYLSERNADHLAKAEQIASLIVSENNFLDKSSLSLEGIYSLGLFTGIGGIGYTFLRVAYPKEIPNILSIV